MQLVANVFRGRREGLQLICSVPNHQSSRIQPSMIQEAPRCGPYEDIVAERSEGPAPDAALRLRLVVNEESLLYPFAHQHDIRPTNRMKRVKRTNHKNSPKRIHAKYG